MIAIRVLAVLGLSLAVSACSGNNGLRALNRSKDGPDEFKILPVKPLEAPSNYTALPVPTPGGVNRTDPSPNADAVAALGGRPSAIVPGDKIPTSESALLQQASRYGVTPDIREELATADADFRRRQGRWTGLSIVPVDRYSQVYEREAMDPYAEAKRFLKLGIQVPAAPPEGENTSQ